MTEVERVHVADVYEGVADHFSSTRYKAWPFVDSWLKDLPAGSIGLDIGGGNGKYLSSNGQVYILCSDQSYNLTKHAMEASRWKCADAMVADVMALPHPPGKFDFSLSIAVLHHLSTRDRRLAATKRILDLLRVGGRCLLYVWALEQESRRHWNNGIDQDVFVPWHAQLPKKTYQRFYHLYKCGELEQDVIEAGGTVMSSGFERDNWWCVACRL